jgi:hypothetical protein
MQATRKRDEMVERSFAHILDRGGMRHAANSRKRYLIHVAWFNLGILDACDIRKGNLRGRERQKRDLVRYSNRFCAVIAAIFGHRRRNGNVCDHHRT